MTTTVTNSIGFIGLGVMGSPMARHIAGGLREGELLHIWARRSDSGADLVAAGAVRHDSPRSLASAVGAIVFMVPEFADVLAVLEGEDGVLAGAGDLVVVVSSTTSPAQMRELDRDLRARTAGRVRVVDAPVSGGEEGAVQGALSIMLGGEEADVAAAARFLSHTGRARHLGPVGSGQLAKACNQMVVAATVNALAEAAVVAERSGMDVASMFDALNAGYAASRVLEVKARRFVEHDHHPSGPARFMIKDLGYAREEAARTGTVVEQTDLLHAIFSRVTADGLGDQDTSVLQEFIERRSPLPG